MGRLALFCERKTTMALSKKPVNGMRDILPKEMEIRDYVTGIIKDTYRSFGFTPIETPCMENIANLIVAAACTIYSVHGEINYYTSAYSAVKPNR